MDNMGMDELMGLLSGIKGISITKKEDLFTKDIKELVSKLKEIATQVEKAGFSRDFTETLILQIISASLADYNK